MIPLLTVAGDVVSRGVGALLARGLCALAAAWLGAYAHALAGDLASERIAPTGLLATDIPDGLPPAFDKLARWQPLPGSGRGGA